MKNLKVKSKLLLGFGILIFLMLGRLALIRYRTESIKQGE